MTKLCFLLPTNDPASMRKYLLPTISVLTPVAAEICFAINFQSPYTQQDIVEVIDKFAKNGIEVKYKVSKYDVSRKGMIPFNRIRYDCATLYPDADYYALCDDDFVLCEDSDLMVQDLLHEFDSNDSIGVIQCDRKPPFIPFAYSKREPKFHMYYTSTGFFFRNLHKEDKDTLVFPQNAVDLLGAGEEYIIGLELASRGYDTYVRTRSTIWHCRELDDNGNSVQGWGTSEIVNGHRGTLNYIRKRYKEVISL